MDVAEGLGLALQLDETRDLLVHFPRAQAAPAGYDQLLILRKAELLARVVPLGVDKGLVHGHADGIDLGGVRVLLPALVEADQNAVHVLHDHAGGKTRHGVGLVHRGGDAQPRSLPQGREAGVAAGAQDHVRLKFLQDLTHPPLCAGELRQGADVVDDGLGRQAALKEGDIDGFKAEALPGNQFLLHALLRADEQDFTVRPALAQHFGDGQGGVDVAAGTAAGEYRSHAFPPALPVFRFMTRRLVFCLDTLRIMPISARFTSSAVPP